MMDSSKLIALIEDVFKPKYGKMSFEEARSETYERLAPLIALNGKAEIDQYRKRKRAAPPNTSTHGHCF